MPVRKTLALALATAAASVFAVATVPAAHAGAPVRHVPCTYEDDYNDIVFYGDKFFSRGDAYCTTNYELTMQPDGNLVEYDPGGDAVWSTRTDGHGDAFAEFQTDGNLVVYVTGHIPIWSSSSWGNTNASLAFQHDGNIVIYRAGNHTVAWTSNTQWS